MCNLMKIAIVVLLVFLIFQPSFPKEKSVYIKMVKMAGGGVSKRVPLLYG